MDKLFTHEAVGTASSIALFGGAITECLEMYA